MSSKNVAVQKQPICRQIAEKIICRFKVYFDIDILQDRVAKCLRCGEIFDDRFWVYHCRSTAHFVLQLQFII